MKEKQQSTFLFLYTDVNGFIYIPVSCLLSPKGLIKFRVGLNLFRQIAENGQPAVSSFRYATSTEPVKFLILELFKKVR